MNNQYDKFEEAVKEFSQGSIPAGPSEDLIAKTLEQIEQTNPKTNPFVERIINMKPFSKFAAAAIILIAVSAVFLFPSGGKSIALAAVYDKVLQTQAFMYKMSMTMTGMGELTGQPETNGLIEMDTTITISVDYGMKMENHMTMPSGTPGNAAQVTQLAYLLPEKKVMVSILPDQKMYQTIEFTDALLEQTKKKNNDPREMIKQMLECQYTELPPTQINGVKVQGFQTSDPALSGGISNDCTVTLWVAVDTWLPIQYEMDMKIGANGQMHAVIDHFQWNIPVDAKDFEYVIPADYKEFGSMKMPEMNQDAAILGLRTYLKFFGTYPEKLDLVSLMASLKNLRDQETEYAKAFREKMESAGGDQAKIQEFLQELMSPLQSLGMFYMRLNQEKRDPAYFGDRVTPGDANAVLLRWKTDDGSYQVIFGDLSTGQMSREDLLKLEAELPLPPQDSTSQDEPISPAQTVPLDQNIKQLLLACLLHARDNNGQWPDRLEDLTADEIDPQILTGPDHPNGYIYRKPNDNVPIAQDIVIYQAYQNWNDGICAGFADGHVEFFADETEFLKQLNQ